MAKILVVEDEPSLVETIHYNLRRERYDVSVALDGEQAIRTAREVKPDLILLDVMLPKVDGFEVCRVLRQETQAPILMLTARTDEIDKVVGLEIGADDYITKPFSFRELMARIKAALRRVEAGQLAREQSAQDEILNAGAIIIDIGRHEVNVDGRQVSLKPKEFDLLVYLARNRGRVMSRDQILQNIWDYEYDGGTRTVDVHVRGLREKVERDPSNPEMIETVRGVGYRLRS